MNKKKIVRLPAVAHNDGDVSFLQKNEVIATEATAKWSKLLLLKQRRDDASTISTLKKLLPRFLDKAC